MTKAKAPPPQTLDRDLLTVDEAAAYLRVHPMTVRRMIREGKLKASQLVARGRVLIAATDIEKLLEKSKH
jgi:excisionase family DNA binding protein